MSRPYKPKEVPGLMPYLAVSDPKKSIEFYTKAFGFEVHGKPMEGDGQIQHVEMSYLDTMIMFGPEKGFGGDCKTPKRMGMEAPIGLYIYCKDVDGQFNRATEGGAKVTKNLENAFWGDRMFQVSDPDGYKWTFAQNIADFDPSKIP